MPDHSRGAQRASCQEDPVAADRRSSPLSLVVTATTASAPEAQAATRKVVIVVGPVGLRHGRLQDSARTSSPRRLAATAPRSVEIYSPYATWARVRDAARGANLLIYLGHGNGWPSPYCPFRRPDKDGMGLNASLWHGNSNTKYYGETYMAKLALAPHAVVVLNRLCYASGNNEWGAGNPTRATAIKRVDNYGVPASSGAGAQAVFASGITSVPTCSRACSAAPSRCRWRPLFWTDPTRPGRTGSPSTGSGTPARRRSWIRTRRAATTARSSGAGDDRRRLAQRRPDPHRGRANGAGPRPAPFVRGRQAAAELRLRRGRSGAPRNRDQATTAASSATRAAEREHRPGCR